MRNYKKVSECPEKLKYLIGVYNLVPADTPLKSQKELEKEAEKATKQFDDYWSNERKVMTARFLENAVLEQTENYPALKECISNQALFGWHNQKKNIYFQFLYFRERFNRILENADLYFQQGYKNELFFDCNKTIVFTISDEGKYQVKSVPSVADLFSEALVGVDASRIKRCPICKNIFWAKKTNSKTCGEPVCIDGLANYKKKIKAKNKKLEKASKKKQVEKQRQEWLNQDFSRKEQK